MERISTDKRTAQERLEELVRCPALEIGRIELSPKKQELSTHPIKALNVYPDGIEFIENAPDGKLRCYLYVERPGMKKDLIVRYELKKK